jgi:hypothetical protein
MRLPARFIFFLAALVAAGAVAGTANAGTVVNGGFETGTFFGWSTANQAFGSGAWFIQSGTTSPLNGFPVSAPPQGLYQAMTDQFGPGSHVLYQNIAVAPGDSLSFWVDYVNEAGLFCTPATLDYTAGCNQQFRVDIMTPSSDPFSVAPGDVLKNAFQTHVGDPTSLAPTKVTVTFWSCSIVRVRAAEVDNVFFFNAGVDGFVLSPPIHPSGIPCII